MATRIDTIHQQGNISTGERIVRSLLAISMLFYPMLTAVSHLEWIAVLPLVAIYPMFTAVVGWDPILFIIETGEHAGKSRQVRTAARFVLAGVGALMILAPLTAPPGHLGWFSLPALFGALPVFIAIFGENPIQALQDSVAGLNAVHRNQGEQAVEYSSLPELGKNCGADFEPYEAIEFHRRAA